MPPDFNYELFGRTAEWCEHRNFFFQPSGSLPMLNLRKAFILMSSNILARNCAIMTKNLFVMPWTGIQFPSILCRKTEYLTSISQDFMFTYRVTDSRSQYRTRKLLMLKSIKYAAKKSIEKARECQNHKPQPTSDTKRKRKIRLVLSPYTYIARGDFQHGAPRSLNHKATQNKNTTRTTALER